MLLVHDKNSKYITKRFKNIFRSVLHVYLVSCLIIFSLIVFRLKTYSGDSLITLVPNFFATFTPFLITTARLWTYVNNYENLPIYEPKPIVEIYPNGDGRLDFEELRRATNGFHDPVVVRGLFANTTAVNKWDKPGYLEQKLSNFSTYVNQDGNSERARNTNIFDNIGDAMKTIVEDKKSTKVLFIPKEERDPALMKAVKDVATIDLDVENLLWRGFGTEEHKTFMFPQIVAANGFTKEAGGRTSGTFWHCDFGNNWIVTVVGKKRFSFIDPKYSSYMKPGRWGLSAFRSPIETGLYEKHFQVSYVDLEKGDMLYNPDWIWHRVENYEGLSISAPFREKNLTLSFSNNFQLTTHTVWFIFLRKVFGYDLPTWGQVMPHD